MLSNKYYRRRPRRMTDFDYNQPGCYFITITPQKRYPYFGTIQNGVVCLNALGQIVYNQWLWLQKYPQIELDQFIVMPDHVHGIICIKDVDDIPSPDSLRSVNPRVDQTESGEVAQSQSYRRRMLLCRIICAFKTTSSKLIHLQGETDFRWKRSYHDKIIRVEEAMEKIQEYIYNNPYNWTLKYGDSANPRVSPTGGELGALE